MNVVLQNEIITIVHDEHEGVPFVVYRPTMMEMDYWPTVYFYHGWSSSKEMQHIRAHLMTTMGYQVVVPDAKYHGERGQLEYEEPSVAQTYLWETVFQNIKEFPSLQAYCIDYYHADKNRIAVLGHSMGGITAAGIIVNCEGVKTAIAMNGGLDWDRLNEAYFMATDEEGRVRVEQAFAPGKDLDPAHKLRAGASYSILTIHGEEDPTVPKEPDKALVEELHPDGSICYIAHPGVGHVVTTNMMGDAILWLGRNL